MEKTINYSLPENADCGGLVGLVLGEEASFFHVPPANIGKFSGNTSILRAPIQVSINNLDVTVAVRDHALDAGDLPLNGSSIFENQCPAAPGTHAYTIGRARSRFNPDHVVAQVMQLLFDPCRTGVTDGDHADKRSYAHGDAQNRQGAPDLVSGQLPERFGKNSAQVRQHASQAYQK